MKNWPGWSLIPGWVTAGSLSQPTVLNAEACRPAEIEPAIGTGARLLGLFMILGFAARLVRYYLCFPLWDDESFLCVNFIDRGFADLLQPLDYHQVAPLLFLWIERAAVGLFGFSEYALRLVPFACSIASLYLFYRVANQLLSGPALLVAVAVFAVSYPGIRYAAEAKPYGTDLFVSLSMFSIVLEWKRSNDARWLWLLAAMMPFALGVSYPAVFAAGGLSLVAGGILFSRKGTKSEWTAWCVWNALLVISFALWFLAVGRVQSGAEAEFMGGYWKPNFPPVAKPWNLPFWFLKTHASDFLAYPVGGPNWASTLTMLLCGAGLWQWARQKQFFPMSLLLMPALLHLLAASLERYPYGGHVKFSQYLAPMICCVIGAGANQIITWTERWNISQRQALAGGCCVLLIIGMGSIVRDLACPYKTRSDFRARAFAQAFWLGAHSSEEVVCLKSDQGLDFVPRQHVELSWSAHYRCNRAIEISRSSLRRADMSRVSIERPLRCVLYRDARYELDRAHLDRWLAEMQTRFELTAHESLPFPRLAKDDRKLLTMEYVDSYKFVPRRSTTEASSPLANGPETQEQRQ